MFNNKHVANIRKITADYKRENKVQKEKLKAFERWNDSGDISPNDYKQEKEDLYASIEQTSFRFHQSLDDEKKAYHDAVDQWALPTGDKVHEDIKVLTGAIPLGLKDLEELKAKHSNNPVMISAIQKYAKDNSIKFFSKSPTPEMKKSAFDVIYNYGKSSIDSPDSPQMEILQDDNHFIKVYDIVLNDSGEIE